MLLDELKQIKEEIYNCGLLHKLLESVGCEGLHLSGNGERLEGARPNGSNNRGFSVYLDENLGCKVWTKNIPTSDIFDLISYFKFEKETPEEIKKCLYNSKNYIIDVLELTQFKSGNYKPKDDPNDWLKELRKKRQKRIDLDEIEPNKILPESTLREFVQVPHQMFLEDGVPYDIQQEFEVGFDIQSERITIPVRNRSGELVGIKGRATRKEDEDKYKYLPIYAFQKSKELFNLHNALPYIRDSNSVICVESEKSVMKLWGMGYKNVVSQMGSEFTKIQAAILKNISPSLKIQLGYDKDKSIKEIKNMARVFGKYPNLYAIYDRYDSLGENDAPCDKGSEVFEDLHNNHCYPIPV